MTTTQVESDCVILFEQLYVALENLESARPDLAQLVQSHRTSALKLTVALSPDEVDFNWGDDGLQGQAAE